MFEEPEAYRRQNSILVTLTLSVPLNEDRNTNIFWKSAKIPKYHELLTYNYGLSQLSRLGGAVGSDLGSVNHH